jgi:putative salt-induced outer membrane protein YdiY
MYTILHAKRAATLLSVFSCIAWADQVVMKNGDRVTGAIVKKDGKTITIKTEQFGVVNAAWDQVESIRADKPLNVVMPDGKTVQATLATSDGKVEVATANAKVALRPAEISTIRDNDEQHAYDRMQHPGWLDLWSGLGAIGIAGTAGNAKTLTFTTNLTVSRVTSTDKTTLYFNTIKASADVGGKSSPTAEAVRGGLSYDHNFGPRMFVNVFNDYEYDKFQNLDLRFVMGGGLGYHAIKHERATLDLLGGIDFNHSSFSTPLLQKSAEAFWGDDYRLKLRGSSSLVQGFRMFNDLTNTGSYRMNFDAGLTSRVAKWLTWNVTLSDRYLNHPAPGRKTNDLLYTTGLGVTFARK